MALSLRETICLARELPRTDAVLMGRAEFLSREDRDLVESVLIRGQPAAQIARLAGRTARSVRRRVHRIGRQLTSREFLDAIRALPYLSADDARLARLYFCQNVPQRPLAQRLGLTLHALRRRLDRLSAQIAAIARWQKAGQPSGGDRAAENGEWESDNLQ